jgi:hypothetical protein
VSVSGGAPEELLPPDYSYTHSIPFGSFDDLALNFTFNGAEIAGSPITVPVNPSSAIYLGATVAILLLVLFVGNILYKIISRRGFDARAEKAVSVDAKLRKILNNKIRVQNVFMGIEVSVAAHSERVCRV